MHKIVAFCLVRDTVAIVGQYCNYAGRLESGWIFLKRASYWAWNLLQFTVKGNHADIMNTSQKCPKKLYWWQVIDVKKSNGLRKS